nr:hypothetical protein [Tanacetum cinerariifolium]
MSLDNAQSAVTCTSISSDLDGPSWGIPLMNANELSKMDPYEEVSQQRQVPPLSPAYVHDPMELNEHVPVYVLEPEQPEYHAPSDDDIQVEDQPHADDASPTAKLLGYIANSDSMGEDDDEDPKEDLSNEHEPEDDDKDPEEDPNKEPEPEDEDTKEEELSKGSDETEPFEDAEIDVTPPPPRHHRARISVRPQTPMAASTQSLIDAFTARSPLFLLQPTSPTYDQALLGHKTAMIHRRDDIPKEDMPPRRRFLFTAPPPGCDVAESSATAARAPRAIDRVEDIGYVIALHASEHRMMTFIEEVNLRISYQAQVCWQESKIMHVTRQGTNDAMTPESIQAMIDRAIQRNSTHTQDDASQSSGEGLRRPVQPARVCSYTDFMKCQPLNFKGTEGVVGLSQWLKKMESVFHISGCAINNQVKFTTCTLLGAALTWWNGHVRTLRHDAAYAMTWGTFKKKLTDKYCPKGKIKKLEIKLWNLRVKGNDVVAYTQRFQEQALMCTKFLANETEKVDKYINGLPDNIHRNVMSARPKTLDETIELANDLMDQKLRTYAERQNDNKRKADDSSRNNQQQQPHKKKNVARAYTVGPGKKKAYTANLPLFTKCNYHHTGHVHPSAITNNGNINGNGGAQGKAYVLGGGDSNPETNTVTGMFLLNNRYASILFDTGSDRSFVSTAFSALLNIAPTALDNHYDVELADGKIIRVNTILRGCTLDFLNHPFNIDLMPVPLGSFDVIISMDWLREYPTLIVCDEKIVRVSFGNETLIFQGKRNDQEAKDKSEGKRLKDVPIVRDFPEVVPEDLPGIPPAR